MAENPTIYPKTDSKAIKEKIHEIKMQKVVEEPDTFKLSYVADYLGIHEITLRKKIDNQQEWKLSEIVKMQKVLGLTNEEREKIFFGNG